MRSSSETKEAAADEFAASPAVTEGRRDSAVAGGSGDLMISATAWVAVSGDLTGSGPSSAVVPDGDAGVEGDLSVPNGGVSSVTARRGFPPGPPPRLIPAEVAGLAGILGRLGVDFPLVLVVLAPVDP